MAVSLDSRLIGNPVSEVVPEGREGDVEAFGDGHLVELLTGFSVGDPVIPCFAVFVSECL